MDRRLNIIISAYVVDKHDIGESQLAYEWISRLSNYATLWVVTAGSRLNTTCGLENNNNVKLLVLKPKISFKIWDSFDRSAKPGYIEFFLRAQRAIKRISREQEIDLCHHLTPHSLRHPTPLIVSDCPIIFGPIHGGMKTPVVMKEFGGQESWFFKLRHLDEIRLSCDPIMRKHYSKVKRILISAPYVKDGIAYKYSHKCSVLSGVAVDSSLITEKYDSQDIDVMRMISVGRIVPSKGFELLILALAKCRLKDKVKLDIYGRGPLEKEYQKLAENIGISDNIKWNGFTPNEKVLKAYIGADLFALPSLKEPAGIAVIEAMASGLPVLCVDAGGPAYSVGNNCGVKVPVSNKDKMVAGLAKAIDFMAANPEKRIEMGKKAQRRIKERFTWDAVIAKMLKVYEEVLAEKS